MKGSSTRSRHDPPPLPPLAQHQKLRRPPPVSVRADTTGSTATQRAHNSSHPVVAVVHTRTTRATTTAVTTSSNSGRSRSHSRTRAEVPPVRTLDLNNTSGDGSGRSSSVSRTRSGSLSRVTTTTTTVVDTDEEYDAIRRHRPDGPSHTHHPPTSVPAPGTAPPPRSPPPRLNSAAGPSVPRSVHQRAQSLPTTPPPLSTSASYHQHDHSNNNNNNNNNMNNNPLSPISAASSSPPLGQHERTPSAHVHTAPKIYFRKALAGVSVPPRLLTSDGVPVTRVDANGRTRPGLALSLNPTDKFTIYIQRRDQQHASSKATSGFLPFLSFVNDVIHRAANQADQVAVDIGEIDRIQRGQATQQFEKAKSKQSKNIPAALHLQRNGHSFASLAAQKHLPLVQEEDQEMIYHETSSEASSSSDKAVENVLPWSPPSSSNGGIANPTTATSSNAASQSTTTTTTTNVPTSNSFSTMASALKKTSTMSGLDPQKSFSIVFRGAQTMDLMAESEAARNEICDALDRILLAYQRAKTRVSKDILLLRYVWLDVDQKQSGYINVTQVGKVLQQINFPMKARDLQAVYDKFGKVVGLDRLARRRGLTFEQSATFLHKLKRDSWVVKPVNVLWNDLFGELMNNGKPRTSVSDTTFLKSFLHGKQAQSQATLLDVRKLFRRLHDMERAHTSSGGDSLTTDWTRIDKDMFETFLISSENDAFDPEREKFEISDMNQSLSEYWINSSHNTYLIGDQLTSQSSVEMYSSALYRGARCLELDIWDGDRSSNGTPIPVVWHGHTMTTKIKFVDIIRTIKVFLNFHPDTYPLILSFENHCSIPYQEVMADQLIQILGDSLYIPTESSLYGSLPSPAQLRGRVLIKGRRPDGTEADAYDTDDGSDDEGTSQYASSNTGSMSTMATALGAESKTKNAVAPQLAKITLFHGTKHLHWKKSNRLPTYHMHSFSENKVRHRCRKRESSGEWIIFNKIHMSRTYPAGSRVDSSNYNPLLAWSVGCQMVALNFQTQDAFLRLNDGRFRENGGCGYVVKPSVLMMRDDASPVSSSQPPVRLHVRVLSGVCLPKVRGRAECIDPCVKVSIFDVHNEEKDTITSQQTSVVTANGFFPIWSQERFAFTVENFAVAMLQVTVIDKTKDDFIASASIPISCLRRGVRSLKLYDATNTRSGAYDFATLLVDIKMGQVVAEI